MKTKAATDIHNRIAGLTGLSRADLLALWSHLYRTPAPVNIRREFLVPFLAYKIQEDAYGGLKASVRSELRKIAKQLNHGKDISRARIRSRISPGTRLLREWHGESHEVIATETGFEYRDERFRSLSQIARKITGTRWSGPVFFGTKPSTDHLDE